MGKLADTERLKLRANYLNNIAVGLTVGGFAIPYLAILPRLSAFDEWFIKGAPINSVEVFSAIGTISAMVLALWGARRARQKVDEVISKLDEL